MHTHYLGMFKTTMLASAIAATSLTFGQTDPNYNEEDDLRLEEVIVTAQKRAESIQDVPVSVATVSGEKIEKAGINTLQDLTSYLSNIHFTQSGFSTQVRVRGIGSDNSQGFEQSVGMYVDGIYYGRAQLFRTPMMDMANVELLRGPQGTLFGKNSVAGALVLNTARPTSEFEGKVKITKELEYGGTELGAVLSGPLSDTLRARLAVRKLDEDGYQYNEFKQRKEPQKEEQAARLSFEWDATDDLSFFVKAEENKFKTRGRAIEITKDENLADPAGPGYSDMMQALFSQPGFDSQLDHVRSTNNDEYSDNTISNFTFIGDYDFSGHQLTFESGWLEYAYDEMCDCDFIPGETVPLPLEEKYEQFSQEIRIASPLGERFEWIGGLFYQNYQQNFKDELPLADGNILPAALNASEEQLNAVGMSFFPDSRPEAGYNPANLDIYDLTNTTTARTFEQDSQSWAAFGQFTWNIIDSLAVTLGGRYTEERKEAEKQINTLDSNTGDPLNANPDLGYLYWYLFKVESQASGTVANGGHDAKGTRNESRFLPLVNVRWSPTDFLMTYARYTEGFKAGGFDPRSNKVGATIDTTDTTSIPENKHFEFENEDAKSFEIGTKTSFSRAEINLAIFHTKFDDLQISQFDGGVGFNVGNAKKTTTQGIELESRMLINQYLSGSIGLAYLDFKYDDFKNGNCHVGQTPDGIDSDGNGDIDTCDYTGKRGAYTPEYTFNLGLDFNYPVNNNVDFFSRADLQYVDEHDVHVNLDQSARQKAYNMLGASIGFEGEQWLIALRGSNLLNEKIVSYAGNVPLSDSFGTNTHYSFVRPPRMIYADIQVKF